MAAINYSSQMDRRFFATCSGILLVVAEIWRPTLLEEVGADLLTTCTSKHLSRHRVQLSALAVLTYEARLDRQSLNLRTPYRHTPRGREQSNTPLSACETSAQSKAHQKIARWVKELQLSLPNRGLPSSSLKCQKRCKT